ncbi:MAG: hypothetical protein EZS28_048223, partial [Streblomastix strix]
LKLVGTKDYVDKGRNIELLIENCTFTQNNTLDKATNFSLLRTEPFLSLRMNVSIFNFKGYNASIEGTGLIEINYEPDVFTWDSHINLVNCSFTNISSQFTSKEIKSIIGEKDDEIPLGVASILNIRGATARILPLYLHDCQFDQCKCSAEIPAKERRQIGVGGAASFCGKTLLLTLEHFRFINCSGNVTFTSQQSSSSTNEQMNNEIQQSNPSNEDLQHFLPISQTSNSNIKQQRKLQKKIVSNTIKKPNYQIEVAGGAYVSLVGGGRGEERFIAKKSLSEYLRLQGDSNKDISHTVNNMSRPWVAFDICVISQCNTSVPVGQSGRLKILEAGGVLVHIERSAAKCNFQSSIFTGCGITTTPWTPVIFSTNIAPCIGQKSEDEIFEPLWDRELRNGK